MQANKAGILEIADVFVVNKADRDGAEQTVRDLRYMLSLGERRDRDGSTWKAPIVRTIASKGEGIDEVVATLDQHREWMAKSGERSSSSFLPGPQAERWKRFWRCRSRRSWTTNAPSSLTSMTTAAVPASRCVRPGRY